MKAVLYQTLGGRPVTDFAKDFPELSWKIVWNDKEAEAALPDAEILLLGNMSCSPVFGEILRRGAPDLRWMHFLSSGYDRALGMGIAPHILLSNSSSTKSPTISEHALTLLLALKRRLPEAGDNQRAHRWERTAIRERMATLRGSTLCIVGLGAIGRALAGKARALGAHVIAVSRSGEPDGTIEKVFPRNELHTALGMSDAVAICTNLEPENSNLIDEAAITAMKPSAYLINIARGELVNETALIQALKDNKIAGAGLDVVIEEPLPTEHPLWDLPNVILTPHVANTGPEQYNDQKKLFAENLARFRAGKPLLNPCRLTNTQSA